MNSWTIFRPLNCGRAFECWIASGKRRRRRAETEKERTERSDMGIRIDSGNGAATEVQQTNRMKTIRDKKQRIPRWGIFLFVILAAFAVARTLQRGVETAKSTQPPVRPVLVAPVM